MTDPGSFSKHTRKLAVFAGVAVLAGGVGVAVASQGGGDAGTRSAQMQPGGMPGQGGMRGGAPDGGGGPGAMDLSALADALGVTTAELQDALQTARPTPGQDGARALAEALGLSEAEVEAALEAARPDGAPPAGAAMTDATPS